MRPRIACIMDKTDLDIVSTCSAWQCSFLLSHHGRHIKDEFDVCSMVFLNMFRFHGVSWVFQGFFMVFSRFFHRCSWFLCLAKVIVHFVGKTQWLVWWWSGDFRGCAEPDEPMAAMQLRLPKGRGQPRSDVFVVGWWSHWYLYIHPGRLTWNLRIHPWKRKIIFRFTIFRFYVDLRGCMHILNIYRWI